MDSVSVVACNVCGTGWFELLVAKFDAIQKRKQLMFFPFIS